MGSSDGVTFKTPYPGYDVLAKWNSPSFNEQTRAVIAARLDAVPGRRFFTAEEWDLVEAIVSRLIPQADRPQPVPITPWIDAALADNKGEGFRHEGMPPMRENWRRGLACLAAEAKQRHGTDFAELGATQQDAVLAAIQHGDVEQALWSGVCPKHFFSHVLLKTAAGIYYSHPAAWSEIGFGGPASPRGYVRMGADRRDPWEAEEVGRA